MKKNVAIVWGGYSSEIVISEKSAAGIYTFLDIGKYNLFKVKNRPSSMGSRVPGESLPGE